MQKQLIGYPPSRRIPSFLELLKKMQSHHAEERKSITDPTGTQTSVNPSTAPLTYKVTTKQTKTTNQGLREEVEIKDNKSETDKKKLDTMIGKPRVLLYFRSVWPFVLFPDSISIEETKVNFEFKAFFSSAQLRSVSIKDIAHIEVSTSPFFATLSLTGRSFVDNPIEIRCLKKQEALRARRVIEGLQVIDQQGIDLTPISVGEILQKAEDLGAAKGIE